MWDRIQDSEDSKVEDAVGMDLDSDKSDHDSVFGDKEVVDDACIDPGPPHGNVVAHEKHQHGLNPTCRADQ